jgi:hypothetical protein
VPFFAKLRCLNHHQPFRNSARAPSCLMKHTLMPPMRTWNVPGVSCYVDVARSLIWTLGIFAFCTDLPMKFLGQVATFLASSLHKTNLRCKTPINAENMCCTYLVQPHMDVGNKHEQTLQRTPSQLQFMSLQEHNLAAEAEWQIDGFLGSRWHFAISMRGFERKWYVTPKAFR